VKATTPVSRVEAACPRRLWLAARPWPSPGRAEDALALPPKVIRHG
jgi:hypothetical protein